MSIKKIILLNCLIVHFPERKRFVKMDRSYMKTTRIKEHSISTSRLARIHLVLYNTVTNLNSESITKLSPIYMKTKCKVNISRLISRVMDSEKKSVRISKLIITVEKRKRKEGRERIKIKLKLKLLHMMKMMILKEQLSYLKRLQKTKKSTVLKMTLIKIKKIFQVVMMMNLILELDLRNLQQIRIQQEAPEIIIQTTLMVLILEMSLARKKQKKKIKIKKARRMGILTSILEVTRLRRKKKRQSQVMKALLRLEIFLICLEALI